MSRPDEICHVTVMPCYDKKLEASRSDFFSDVYRTRDVDCVITTGMYLYVEYGFSSVLVASHACLGEVEQMLLTDQIDLKTLPLTTYDKL